MCRHVRIIDWLLAGLIYRTTIAFDGGATRVRNYCIGNLEMLHAEPMCDRLELLRQADGRYSVGRRGPIGRVKVVTTTRSGGDGHHLPFRFNRVSAI